VAQADARGARGGALVVYAAKAIGRWHYDPTIWPLAGWYVPPDFGDFYAAAGAVLRSDSPYPRLGKRPFWRTAAGGLAFAACSRSSSWRRPSC
jgi:hypothetical protein